MSNVGKVLAALCILGMFLPMILSIWSYVLFGTMDIRYFAVSATFMMFWVLGGIFVVLK